MSRQFRGFGVYIQRKNIVVWASYLPEMTVPLVFYRSAGCYSIHVRVGGSFPSHSAPPSSLSI